MLDILNWLLNDDFTSIYNRKSKNFVFCNGSEIINENVFRFIGLIHLKTLRGYALQDILTEISRFIQLSK